MWSAVIIVRLYWKLNFLDKISKNIQISNFIKKIRPEGAESNAGGRTDV